MAGKAEEPLARYAMMVVAEVVSIDFPACWRVQPTRSSSELPALANERPERARSSES